MENRNCLTKVLAIMGTVLAFIPLLAPAIFGLLSLINRGRFLFDYLMPAEIFPIALVGGIVLIWAAARAKSSLWMIIGSLLAAILLLVGSQWVAEATGLASGRIQAEGTPWMIVVGMLIGFVIALAGLCLGGLRLLNTLFKRNFIAPTGD